MNTGLKHETFTQCWFKVGPTLSHWLGVYLVLAGTLLTDQMKWNKSGFRPLLCTYRLNWARRTFWGWWDEWDDTVRQTQDSKFEPWRSEAEHPTSRSRRPPTIPSFTRGWGRYYNANRADPTPTPNMVCLKNPLLIGFCPEWHAVRWTYILVACRPQKTRYIGLHLSCQRHLNDPCVVTNNSDLNRGGVPANTNHLYKICTMSAHRLRRWSNIVQMLYKCFVFTGIRLCKAKKQ